MRFALIPARAQSKRLPKKNIRPLAGKPLISWTIDAALESDLFDRIYVCSDDFEVLALAQSPVICHQRPPSSDEERDIDWLLPTLEALKVEPEDECWLLRPTSPFRSAQTIRRAANQWIDIQDRVDSLRAMRRTTEPGWKQWVIEDILPGPCSPSCACSDYPSMRPLTTAAAKKGLHSFPTQSLEDTYIQTAGLEVFWARTILEKKSLAGDIVGMFEVEGPEALDINDEAQWAEAERLVAGSGLEPASSRIRP